jgi:hypothetical protein
LYQALSVEYGPEAYRYYQSLVRRLVNLEQALENQARNSRGGCPDTIGLSAPNAAAVGFAGFNGSRR